MMQVAAFALWPIHFKNLPSVPRASSLARLGTRGRAEALVLACRSLVSRLQLIDTRVIGVLDCLQTRIIG